MHESERIFWFAGKSDFWYRIEKIGEIRSRRDLKQQSGIRADPTRADGQDCELIIDIAIEHHYRSTAMLRLGHRTTLFVRVDNLADAPIETGQTQPGLKTYDAPRTVLAGLTLGF